MTIPLNAQNNEKKINRQKDDPNASSNQIAPWFDLSSDADYIQLMDHYQSGDFSKCMKCYRALEKRYPSHPELLSFKEDFVLKLYLQSLSVLKQKEQNHKNLIFSIKIGYLIVFLTIFVLIVVFYSYSFITNNLIKGLTNVESVQIQLLNTQVEELILEGQPEAAAESLEMIRKLNPDDESLPMLTTQVYELLELKADYQNAMSLIADERDIEALDILTAIEQERPGLWDVSQQIDSINVSLNP